MKLRKRQSKPLDLSASLAQSNWAADLQKTPVFRPLVADEAGSRAASRWEAQGQAAASRRFDSDPLSSAALRAADLAAAKVDAPDDEAATDLKIAPPAPSTPAVKTETKTETRTAAPSRSQSGWTAPRPGTRGEPAWATTRPRASTSKIAGQADVGRDRDDARHAYLLAALAALLWGGGLIAFVAGFEQKTPPLGFPPFQAFVLAGLIAAPAAAMLFAAFALRQGARLGSQTRRTERLAEEMMQPAALAATRSVDVVERVRGEIERASGASSTLNDQLTTLRTALGDETDRLTEAAAQAQRSARVISETLGRERAEITALAASLHVGAREIGEAVRDQTRLVAEASDLARSQLNEAEAALAARAADIAQSTTAAGAAAREAGDQLGLQTEALDLAAAALTERIRHLDARLAEQRDGLAEVLERCNVDQDDIAVRLETRRAQLLDAVAQSRAEAFGLAEASQTGADAVRRLTDAASERVSELGHMAEAERTRMADELAQTRSAMQAELERHAAALAEAARAASRDMEGEAARMREAATSHVQGAKAQVEQLGELAFDAGQRANAAFDARINDARRLIEQTAGVIEEAGTRSAARIETGLDAARAALGQLAAALTEVDAKMSRLPDDARQQADAVREAVDRGVGDLTASARRLVEETQSIDAAFQDRVRRNYESLSEATRLMARAAATAEPGRSAGAAPAATAPPVPTPAPPAPPAAEPPASPRTPEIAPPQTLQAIINGHAASSFTIKAAASSLASASPAAHVNGRDPIDPPAPTAAPAAQPASPREDEAFYQPGPLRPRLRLTPTEADAALRTVFDPLQAKSREAQAAKANGEPPAARAWDAEMDEWTWKDLLASIDETPPIGDAQDDTLAAQMIGEIAALGVDAGALLPDVRVEAIAATLQSGDPAAARDSVRRLAPAAIRRLSRRVLTDSQLREQADRYVQRYQGLLNGSASRGEDATCELLGSDPGRAYLLLDAAIGDL